MNVIWRREMRVSIAVRTSQCRMRGWLRRSLSLRGNLLGDKHCGTVHYLRMLKNPFAMEN